MSSEHARSGGIDQTKWERQVRLGAEPHGSAGTIVRKDLGKIQVSGNRGSGLEGRAN